MSASERLKPSSASILYGGAKDYLASITRKVNAEGVVVIVILAVAWQIASAHYPPFLFPSIERIGTAIAQVFTSPDSLSAAAGTYLRIIVALVGSFVASTLIGVVAAMNRPFERAVVPLIELKQGIPGVCWVILAILWFSDTEQRIAFVVITSTVPIFFYQVRDGVRGIPAELWDMVRAMRPSRWQIVRKLIIPSLVPSFLTSWRINVGTAVRVTVMAELLGGISGIGYQLRLSQELFRMDLVIAWTLVLVAFVVVSNALLAALEAHALRWRKDKASSDD